MTPLQAANVGCVHIGLSCTPSQLQHSVTEASTALKMTLAQHTVCTMVHAGCAKPCMPAQWASWHTVPCQFRIQSERGVSSVQASIVSTLSGHGQQVAQLQAVAKRQERLAEERLLRAEQQIASMAQSRRELDNKVGATSRAKADIALCLKVVMIVIVVMLLLLLCLFLSWSSYCCHL